MQFFISFLNFIFIGIFYYKKKSKGRAKTIYRTLSLFENVDDEFENIR